jgi:DNA-binding NarL/FixJ family response regulator
VRFYFDIVCAQTVYADDHGDEFDDTSQASARADEIREQLIADTEWEGYAIEVHDSSENLISYVPLSRESSSVDDRSGPYRLSPREQFILNRLSRGSTNKEIGVELSLSVRVVDIYRARMFDRIEVGRLASSIENSRTPHKRG